MASTPASKNFLQAIQNRRTVYALSDRAILPDDQLKKLVQQAMREAPSAFNIQSSRAVILLGKEHQNYWQSIVPEQLRAIAGQQAVTASEPKLKGFAAGYGTVLFFEDQELIHMQQKIHSAYASNFPIWSHHASGMAQIHVWSLLETEGYGASLQHYGNLTEVALKKRYNLPSTYQIQAELVFGFPEQPAGEKTYMPDHERVIAYGHSA